MVKTLTPQIVIFLFLTFLNIFVGQSFISPFEIETHSFIISDLRFSTYLVAIIVGAIFSVSGLLMQLIFSNNLATPYTLGISSSSIFMVVLSIVIGINYQYLGVDITQIFSIIGSFLTMYLIFKISPKGYSFLYHILLIGIALNIFFNAAMMLIQYFSNLSQLYHIIHWIVGSIEVVEIKQLYPIISIFIIQTAVIFYHSSYIDLISVDPNMARDRGIDVDKIYHIILITQAISLGAIIPITGPIPFIGLIIPNIVRSIFKVGIKKLYIYTAIMGINFTLLAHFLSQRVLKDQILPIGIITAIVGSIFLIISIFIQVKDN